MENDIDQLSEAIAVVVNDDPTQLNVLALFLRKAGLEPRAFSSAQAALVAMSACAGSANKVIGSLPAIIVTDLYMPGIDGWRFCRLLRSPEYAAFNQVPILVVSATFSGDEASRIAADLGAEAFLSSPVDSQRFCEQVRAILEGRQMRRALRILIVDDDSQLCDMLEDAFENQGYQADTAFSIREAVEAFGKAAYDVAVLDYHLPDGSGADLLDIFHAKRPGCVCLMVTGDTGPHLALEWMKKGVAACLQKPFQPAYLIELCAKACRERALLRVQDLLEVRTRELRESERAYRKQFFNNSSVMLLIDPSDGAIIDANASALGFYGYPQERLLAMRITDINELAASDVQQAMASVPMEQGKRFQFQHRLANGSVRDVEVSSSRIHFGDRAVLHSIIHDITERKQAEEALRQSKETALRNNALLRSIMESPQDMVIFALDSSYCYTTFTQAHRKTMKAIWGVVIEVGMNMLDTISNPDDREKARSNFDRALQGEHFIEVEEYGDSMRYRTIYEDRYGPVYVDDGVVSGLTVFVTDITERRRAEEALARSRTELKAIYDNAPVMMCVVDENRRVLYANPAFTAFTGTLEEALKDGHACGVFGCINALEDPRGCGFGTNCRNCALRLALEDTFKTGTGHHNIEHQTVLMREGNRRDVVLLGSTALIHEAEQNRLLLCLHDITERKRAEESLRGNEAKQRAMVANITDVIAIIDRDGINRYKSPNIEKWFGWRPEEVVGVSTWKNVHSEDLERTQNFFGALLREPNATGTGECRYRCKDGTYKWIEFTAVNLLHDRDILGVLLNYHDLTERKRAEEEKTKLEVQFQQAQKMESVGRLAGGVAHDFNNMLQAIQGNADMALEKIAPGSPMRESLEEIQKAARRSADLTRQLLAFARRQTIAPRVLDLNADVENLIKMLRRLIGEDIDLSWLPAAGLGLVMVDPTQIDQILANLCVNARDAIGGVGKITIETRNAVFDQACCAEHPGFVAGEYVLLSVSDNGCGMDKETLAHIFEPFFTTKGVGEGTGLGLATVYGIVKQNNGSIQVQSEPGHGTTFNIYLPRHGGQPALIQTQRVAEPARSTGETLLLVEDEQAILAISTRILEWLGYAVLTASTPDEAIRLANQRAGEIHLLVTDVVMPGMNGRDLARRLLTDNPKLKCLFMSGYTADIIATHGVMEDGVCFIQKPFSMHGLATKVREVLDAGLGL